MAAAGRWVRLRGGWQQLKLAMKCHLLFNCAGRLYTCFVQFAAQIVSVKMIPVQGSTMQGSYGSGNVKTGVASHVSRGGKTNKIDAKLIFYSL
jgi:hypothetical protein